MNRQRCFAWVLLAIMPAPVPSLASEESRGGRCDVAIAVGETLPVMTGKLAGVTVGVRQAYSWLVDQIRTTQEVQALAARDQRLLELDEAYGYWEDECGDGYQVVPSTQRTLATAPAASYPLVNCLAGYDADYDAAVYGLVAERDGAPYKWLAGRGRQVVAGVKGIVGQLEPLATVEDMTLAYRDELECRGYPVRLQDWAARWEALRLAAAEPRWYLATSPSFDSWIEDDCTGYSFCYEPVDDTGYHYATAEVAPAVARSVDITCRRPLLLAVAQTLGGVGTALQEASQEMIRLADADDAPR